MMDGHSRAPAQARVAMRRRRACYRDIARGAISDGGGEAFRYVVISRRAYAAFR